MSREQNRVVWEERLVRFFASKVTVAEFCRREDVSVASFYYWKRRLRASEVAEASVPLFVPVSVRPAGNTEIRIELPGGATVCVPANVPVETLQTCIAASFADGGNSAC